MFKMTKFLYSLQPPVFTSQLLGDTVYTGTHRQTRNAPHLYTNTSNKQHKLFTAEVTKKTHKNLCETYRYIRERVDNLKDIQSGSRDTYHNMTLQMYDEESY